MATSPLAVGKRFGGYQVIRRLGEGGMGEVFLATAPDGRLVALKVPKFDRNDAEGRKRFAREAATAGALDHPNICPVRQVGEIDGQPFLEMEYIDGPSLSAFCVPDKLLKPQQVAFVLRRLALGLAAAHERGIVHRDLKPGNVILRKSGEPVVTDFGLARTTNPDATRVTQSGMVVGSPAYMAPEQIDGESGEIGPASDIYSLGVVLFEMLTGRVPFEGAVGRILVKVLTEPPPVPSTLRPGVDPMLDELCLKMLQKRPADRCGSMVEIAEALHAHFTRPPAAPNRAETRVGSRTIATGTPAPGVAAGMNAAAADDRSQSELAALSSLIESRTRPSRLSWSAARSLFAGRRWFGLPAAYVVGAAVVCLLVSGASLRQYARRSAPSGARIPGPTTAGAAESTTGAETSPASRPADGAGSTDGSTNPAAGGPSGNGDTAKSNPPLAIIVAGKQPAPAGLMLETYSGVDLDGALLSRATTDRINTAATTVARGSRCWTGCLTPPAAGVYTLQMRSDDGARVWLDGTLVLDEWRGRLPDPPLETRLHLKQRAYWLQVAHYESGMGTSTWVLSWRRENGGGLMQPIPATAFTLAPDAADDCNRVAWYLATTFDARVRNGKRAVEIATRANERTDWTSPQYLDTMAAALAEAGDFEEAVRRQTEATRLALEADRPEYRRRLENYQKRATHRSSVTSLRLDSSPILSGPASSTGSGISTGSTTSGASPGVTLPAPSLRSPAAGAVLASSPRIARCLWDSVPGATSYRIEVHRQNRQKWEFQYTAPVSATTYSINVSNTQTHRWRVTAVDGSGRSGTPSDWRTFKFSR